MLRRQYQLAIETLDKIAGDQLREDAHAVATARSLATDGDGYIRAAV